MAYFNFKLAESYALISEDVLLLQMIYQNKQDDMSSFIEPFSNSFQKLENQGLIKYISGSKKSTSSQLIRLTTKGNDILDTIQIPEIDQDDLQVFEYLESFYKKNNKEIGNAKKTKLNIALFKKNSNITRNHLVYLCKSFISDEREIEYSQRLEYLFFKPANVFTVRFDIDSSRLYQFYLKQKDYFDKKFLEIEN